MFKLKNVGKSEYTVRTVSNHLKYLSKHVDLDTPEDVRSFIANKKCSNSYKNGLAKSYNHYVNNQNLAWKKPYYKSERKIPRIPTKESIEKIISRSSRKYATIFRLLVETGVMPHELQNVTLRDIDLDQGTLSVQGSKGHSSRIFKLRNETLAMLKTYLNKHSSNSPFPKSEAMGKRWRKFRNIVADNLKEPQLRTIRLYDLRHYYATMTYYKTKDILYVKQQMGHKKIETTLIYTQLVNFGEEEYTCRVAKTIERATSLIEAGFEYVTEMDNIRLFKKRK